jgi:hypothetical protein
MLNAYFDESGTHAGSPVFVVAGLVASPRQWIALTRDWQRVLGKHGLQWFHTVDCAHGQGMFRDWSDTDRGRLYRELIRIVVKRVAFRLWSVVLMRDFRRFFADPADQTLYQMCMIGCMSSLKILADERSQLIPVTFEGGGKGGGRAIRYLQDNPDFYGAHRPSFDDKKQSPPIQAADIHAYELYKFFAERTKLTGGRPIRDSFHELRKIREGGDGGCIFDSETIQSFLGSVRAKRSEIVLPKHKLSGA